MMKLKAVAIGCLSCCLLAGCWNSKKQKPAKTFEDDPLFKEVIALVQDKYVKEPDINKMLVGALSGMLSSLDSYSAYLPADSYKLLADSAYGEFGGIGVEIFPSDGGVRVISAIDETPAAKAGIQPGDLIIAIDDKATQGMSYSEILTCLHGRPGTLLKVTVQRGEEEIIFPIKRSVVVINPVKLIIKDNIAYIRIGYFNESVAARLKETAYTLQKLDKKVTGLVLDLRNNPGGLLEQAVNTVGYFIKEGIVAQIVDRTKKVQLIETKESVSFPDVPLIVLINSGSASASEIVAAALKYHKRAVILGKRSYGKGSIQSVFAIPGYGGVKLTTAKFLTPAGEELTMKGVQPDITVDSAPNMMNMSLISNKSLNEDDLQVSRSFEILKSVAALKRWQ
ncbi:S41 family peptidase [Candidatus Odyssella thessalonicensis]|uniref:S41 family peptidase n=1 Tax=Candidatus Odyssella thessalonicensis TaxID=84647 RepID=UPI000225ABC0|nr:S41 family peptidase [Candidatus Odyssella thessalonicensis]